MATAMRREGFNRCFITGPRGPKMEKIARLLTERGIEVLGADQLLSPSAITSEEILRHIAAADFVAAVLPSPTPPNVLYELGVANGLRKPVLAFVFGSNFPLDLRGLYVVRLGKTGDWGAAAGDVDRFLRHAKAPPPFTAAEPAKASLSDLGWARDRLRDLKSESAAARRGIWKTWWRKCLGGRARKLHAPPLTSVSPASAISISLSGPMTWPTRSEVQF
jgi:hypothetical protein